jgi:hypothetical protein
MQNPPTVIRSLSELLEKVEGDQLILPEIQRDFVWQKRSVMLLFDSLFRGLPIGHMLVWKAKLAVAAKHFHGRKLRPGVPLDNFYGYLLDGQQRLTALAHVRDADDEYRLMFCTWPKRESEETFVWQRNWNKNDDWYISVAEVLQGHYDVFAYLDRIKKNDDYDPTFKEPIHDDLFKLKGLLHYNVGVIEFETDDYREATELFIRFNSTGKRLSRSDLFLAELGLHVPGLATKNIHRVAQKWPNFRFTMPFLTQCLLAVCSGRLKTKAKKAWQDSNGKDYSTAEIREAWRKTERGLDHVVRFIAGTVRWESADLIPSFNALIPLVVIAAENDGITTGEAELARRWLLLAGVRAYFSGSAHTEIDGLLKNLKNNKMSVHQLWKATSRDLRKLKPSDFEVSRISGPVTSLYLSMLADNDARDWCDRYFRLNGKVIGHNAQLQVHHFFPRSLLRKHGINVSEINTFSNYTVISKSCNLEVGAEAPATYMKRVKVPDAELKKQCIPADRNLWHLDRYDDFLKERCRLLAEAANKFLGCKG